MKLEIENKGVDAYVDRVEDFIDSKLCKVVIKIIQQDEVDGQPLQSFYNIVEAFPYAETWEDAEILNFAVYKVNKRFQDMNLNPISETTQTRRSRTILVEEEIVENKPLTTPKKKLSLWRRLINFIFRK
jgi:hypothetical protein